MAAELQKTATELETTVKALEEERQRVEELKDTSVLAHQLAEERTKVATLQFQAASLQQEKLNLEQKLATIKMDSAAQLAAYKEELDCLKGKVAGVINRLLAKGINEAQCSKELEELGCHVEFIEAEQLMREQEWDGQTSLLLEDRDRMRMLVHGATTARAHAPPQLGGSGSDAAGAAQRFPVVTFPQLKGPMRVNIPPLRLADLASAGAAACEARQGADTGFSAAGRDQAAPLHLSLGYSPEARPTGRGDSESDRAARLEHLSKMPKIKFVYGGAAQQGQQNTSPWIAPGAVQERPACVTSTSPVPTFRAPEHNDSMLTSSDQRMVAKW
ncbi:hypothetical protein FOA52_011555 [Chlamydomonas sp. UWO 241]|nr:hypothetical protein FOA52_011555 [Chlamydomonas sp. UWO 241]